MGKGQRTRTSRADKQRRRQIRKARQEAPAFGIPGSWHPMGAGSTFNDADFTAPDEALLDTSGCPVADTCAGCGGTTHLHAVTSAFTNPAATTSGAPPSAAPATANHSCTCSTPPRSPKPSLGTPATKHELGSGAPRPRPLLIGP
jgi:hypothetical protein